MLLFFKHFLSASLIGALFLSGTAVSAQVPQAIEIQKDYWQIPADVIPLKHDAHRIQAKTPKSTVEVIEFFSYSCTHCAAFAPKINAWHKQQPESVRLIYLPVSWQADMVAPQRLFFTLQKLNRLDLHEQVFSDLTKDPNRLANDNAVLNWALRNGFDEKTWRNTYHSTTVTQNMRLAQQTFQDFGLNGVPSIVVNGRYALIPSNQVLDTLNNVVTHERSLTP